MSSFQLYISFACNANFRRGVKMFIPTRMNGVLERSQVGERQPAVAGLSSVYAVFGAKVRKSISIMGVSGEADGQCSTS